MSSTNWPIRVASGGVTSINSLTGAVTFAAGTNITLTPVGNTITIDAAGGGPSVPISAANGGFGLSMARTAIATTGTINNQALATGWLDFGTSSAAVILNGLVAQADGTTIFIRNSLTGTAILRLVDQAAGSTAANRFALGANIDLQIGDSAFLRYNGTTSRWNVQNQASASSTNSGSINVFAQSFTGLKTFLSNVKTPQLINSSGGVMFDLDNNTLGDGLPSNTMIDLAQYKINRNSNVLAWNVGSGLMYDSAGILSLTLDSRTTYDSAQNQSINYETRKLVGAGGTDIFNWDVNLIKDNNGIQSISPDIRLGYDSSGNETIDYQSGYLVANTGNVRFGWRDGYIYYSTGTPAWSIESATFNDSFGVQSINHAARYIYDSFGSGVIGWTGNQQIGFFSMSSTPAFQQIGGANTAGPSYGSTEQTMLQLVYDTFRAYGLLT